MVAAATGETELEGGKRLVPSVFELVDTLDANDGLGGNELNGDLLIEDRVPRAQGHRTTGCDKSGGRKQNKRQRRSEARFQSATIVARETQGGKKTVKLGAMDYCLARLAATDADETAAGVIARRFASSNLAVGLAVSHTGLDLVQNLLLAKPGIFQARDLRSAERGMALEPALQNKLHEVIRQADEAKSDSIAADGIELIGTGNFENLLLGIAGAGEIGGRVAAGERVLSFVSGGHQGNACIVAQLGVFDLHELGDFGI
jgi:hypothetical protein